MLTRDNPFHLRQTYESPDCRLRAEQHQVNLRGYPLQQWCSVSFAAGLVNTCMIGEHYLVIRKNVEGEMLGTFFFFLEPKFPQDSCGLRLFNTPPPKRLCEGVELRPWLRLGSANSIERRWDVYTPWEEVLPARLKSWIKCPLCDGGWRAATGAGFGLGCFTVDSALDREADMTYFCSRFTFVCPNHSHTAQAYTCHCRICCSQPRYATEEELLDKQRKAAETNIILPLDYSDLYFLN